MSDTGPPCGIGNTKVGPQGIERNVNKLRKAASVVGCALSFLFLVRILVFENNEDEHERV